VVRFAVATGWLLACTVVAGFLFVTAVFEAGSFAGDSPTPAELRAGPSIVLAATLVLASGPALVGLVRRRWGWVVLAILALGGGLTYMALYPEAGPPAG
jgi:hypothetical protein